ncbi:MAG: chromate resistance protein [Planctomycetaceae bacterium]|nr:chromate resistance protein [Planctomycetaceae bacterium]
MLIIKIAAGFFTVIVLNAALAKEPDIFSTWEGFEADKCASVWLIKRFIAPQAEIHFYPRGDVVTEGVAFDTPEAQFRRHYNKSTFEMLQEHYQINDESVTHIGRIIHDIEVNIWGNKLMAETHRVIREVQPIIIEENPEKAAAKCQVYFNQLYQKFEAL